MELEENYRRQIHDLRQQFMEEKEELEEDIHARLEVRLHNYCIPNCKTLNMSFYKNMFSRSIIKIKD